VTVLTRNLMLKMVSVDEERVLDEEMKVFWRLSKTVFHSDSLSQSKERSEFTNDT
jgi:hypothetical protein